MPQPLHDDNQRIRKAIEARFGKLCKICTLPARRERVPGPSERIRVPSPPGSSNDKDGFVYLFPTKPRKFCWYHNEEEKEKTK